MGKSINRVTRLISCSLILFSLGLSVKAQHRKFRGNREARPYTQRLPPVDKVEIMTLKTREMWFDGVEASKTLEGDEARKIALLWRTQNYMPSAAMCHYPAFAIKFYSKDKVLVYVTLCWACDNIIFMTPKLKEKQGFDGKSRKGKALLQVFQNAFSQKP